MTEIENLRNQIAFGQAIEADVSRFLDTLKSDQPAPLLGEMGLTVKDGFSQNYWNDKQRRLTELQDAYAGWERSNPQPTNSRNTRLMPAPRSGKVSYINAVTQLLQVIQDSLATLRQA